MSMDRPDDIISFLQRGGLESRIEAMLSDPSATAGLAQKLTSDPDLASLARGLALSDVPALIEGTLNSKQPGQRLLEAVCRSPITIDLARALLEGDPPPMRFGNAAAARRLGPRSPGNAFAHDLLTSEAGEQLVRFAASDGPMASVELESKLLNKNEALYRFADNERAAVESLAGTEAGQALALRLVDGGVPARMSRNAQRHPDLADRDHASVAFARACLMASSFIAVITAVVLVAAHAGAKRPVSGADSFVDFHTVGSREAKLRELARDSSTAHELAVRLVVEPASAQMVRRLQNSDLPLRLLRDIATLEHGPQLIQNIAVSESGQRLIAHVATDPDARRLADQLSRVGILTSLARSMAELDATAHLTRWLGGNGIAPNVISARCRVDYAFYTASPKSDVPLPLLGGIEELVDLVARLEGGGALQAPIDEHGDPVGLFIDTPHFAALGERLGEDTTLEHWVLQLTVASEPHDLARALAGTDAGLGLAQDLIGSTRGRQFAHLVATSAVSAELVRVLTSGGAAAALRARLRASSSAFSNADDELIGATLAIAALTLGPALIERWFAQAASYLAVVAAMLVLAAAWSEPNEDER